MSRKPARGAPLGLAALFGAVLLLVGASPAPKQMLHQPHRTTSEPIPSPSAMPTAVPTIDPIVVETGNLVYVTGFGALASLLVVIVAVGIPMWQRHVALEDERRRAASQLAEDKLALVSYANYFGEQMEHVRDTKGQLGAACRRALDRVLPVVMQHVGRLPSHLQGDAVFAFSNVYKVASQAELDDVRIISMMESFNQRRRAVTDVPSPQSPGILQRLEQDEERFKTTRAQGEQMIVDNAALALKELDALSHALGGAGVKTRADVYYANPQDTKTDRFRTE